MAVGSQMLLLTMNYYGEGQCIGEWLRMWSAFSESDNIVFANIGQ